MAWELTALALSTLLAEDVTCIAAGALVASGRLDFAPATLACFTGIVAGDLALYAVGRVAGRRLLTLPFLRKRISEGQLDLASEWISRRGASVVVASRFMPGMRLPVYLASGALRTNAWQFTGWFILASSLWTPALVGLSTRLGQDGTKSLLAGAGVLIGGRVVAGWLMNWKRRRRITGWIRRKLRWEFWPSWAAYAPVIPWILLLAVRFRSWTAFTAANPGIEASGFVGESKAAILGGLQSSGAVARFVLLEPGPDRFDQALDWMAERGLSFPIVLKPDQGERGNGVGIIRDIRHLQEWLSSHSEAAVLQEFVPGVEYGVFYCRLPEEAAGRVISLTAKTMPAITGDGARTVEELILADDRAVCLADAYCTRNADRLDSVLAAGDTMPLIDLGTHCMGSVFLNATDQVTPALEERIDEVSKTLPGGFQFGRYDVRAESLEALRRGEFRVLELNGVTGEPAHIYDPSVSLFEAYRTLFRHWWLAFRIGSSNQARGHQAVSLRGFFRMVWAARRGGGKAR